MGRTHLALSRRAEASLLAAMVSAQPLVIRRSALTDRDVMSLVDEWELYMAQDTSLYQMGDERGRQTLTTMWNSMMWLEHDLQDSTTQDPIWTWLTSASRGSAAARVWQLQQQLEGVAASHSDVLRRTASATGLVSLDAGGPTCFDGHNTTAMVLTGMKTFLIAPPNAMRWEDGPQNGNRYERSDVHPLVRGRYPEPRTEQWKRALLGPGDVLHLPSGWWHHVIPTSHSIMTNVHT
jgi:hypothetical protein